MTAYYFDASLQKLQKIAQEACYSTELHIKTQAENYFHLMTRNPNIDLIINLCSQGSDTLIFVIFNYLAKNSSTFGQDINSFIRLMQTIRKWQMRENSFIRPNTPPLQKFVANTILTAIGVFLKNLYERQQTSKLVAKYVQDLQNNYFKLLILRTFVQAIQVVDNEMGYMRYRTMAYNFQDNVIPMICETLMPFFYSIEEGVRISQLSYLQEHLKVNEHEQQVEGHQLPIPQDQELKSQQIFMLLKKILEFNYNITYTQYQSEQAIDTCLITFPDRVMEKIINQQFINALFFIIEKVSEVKVGQNKKQYLAIGLDCLAKLMQSRLTYISEENKQKYILHSVNGLYKLLKKCQAIGSQILLEGILICNKKLLMNVELEFIKKSIVQDPVFQNSNLYQIYLSDLTNMITLIVKKSYINCNNHLLGEALEVANRLMGNVGHKDQQNIDEEYIFFMEFIQTIINNFIASLCQPKIIFSSARIISLADNKQTSSQFFQSFKKLASFSYMALFQRLTQALNYFNSSNRKNTIILANLLLLLTQLIDHNYLQRNVYLNKAKDSEVAILGHLVRTSIQLIRQYRDGCKIINQNQIIEQNYKNNKDNYLDMAVIIFLDSILLQFLISFQGNVKLKIKQRLYLIMEFGQNYNGFFQPQDEQSEPTIMMYISFLLEYVATPYITPEDQAKVVYVLDVIQKIIFKLKWNMRRQCFIRSELFKFLSNYFQQLFYHFKNLSLRSKAAKIIVSLTFDDVLDEYKFRISKLIKIIKIQQLMPLLYDFIGIFDGIQTTAISRYFCNRLKRQLDLNQFFSQIFQMARIRNEQQLYKDVCLLCKLVVLNKGLKISNNCIVYQMFGIILPHLIWFIKNINGVLPIDFDLWGESLFEIIQLFNGVINGTHINIYMLDHSTARKQNGSISYIKQFIIDFFKTIILLTSNLKIYPKMQEAVLNLLISANKQILQYIYDDQNGALAHVFNLTMLGIMDLAVEYVNMLLDGNRTVQDRMIKVMDCIRLFYVFFNKKCKMVHKVVTIANLTKFYNLTQNAGNGENKIQKLIFYLVSFILTNYRYNITYLRTLAKLMFELNKLFSVYIFRAFQKIGVAGNKLGEVQKILSYFNQQEQSFVEHFKTWIKQYNQFK